MSVVERPVTSRVLGGEYPYVWKSDGRHVVSKKFEDVIESNLGPRTIDPVAVLSVLSFEYICLDRTVIQGVFRQPWFSSLHSDRVEFLNAPSHGERRLSAHAIAEDFLELYETELTSFIEAHHERIYILLSGGMDSRVMAAVLKKLQQDGTIKIPIEAVTWGKEDSRDVVYGREIADHLGWKWHWAPLDARHYERNFRFGALALGGEVDPKHLHRMDWFEGVPKNSLVLAASYGDSVGRAEFSSVHLSRVKELVPQDLNRILLPGVYRKAKRVLSEDIAELASRHGMRSEVGLREIERQAHYMRRHLCTTMNVINRWADLRQSFTTPEVFGFMWSIHPENRTDDIYVRVLEMANPALLEVPWARTGRRYNSMTDVDVRGLSRGFHEYGRWLRENLAEEIHESLFDGTLARLNLFDLDQIKWLHQEWLKERVGDDTRLCTQLSFLASLSMAAKHAGLEPLIVPPLRQPAGYGLVRNYARLNQRLRRVSRPLRH